MILIEKSKEPKELTEYRRKIAAAYGALDEDVKDKLKESLLEEQGYICCYCMQRISKENMKIEHWDPQNLSPNKQLLYTNMFAACKGNEKKGNRKEVQTCDTRKGELQLNLNPLKKSDMDTIYYTIDGKIFSSNSTFNEEINTTLNLNYKLLVKARKEAVNAVIDYLVKKNPKGCWSKAVLQSTMNKYLIKNGENQYNCFLGAITYYLQKKMKSAN